MILTEAELDIETKVATAIASPCVVHLISRHVPGTAPLKPGQELVFHGCGTIIECEEDHDRYVTTIITAATLFVRTNGVHPSQIQVDVYLSDATLCQGQVFACDFHYNLAAVQIITPFPLQTATVRPLDDVLSIHPTNQLQVLPKKSFQLRPHSNLFKINPETKISNLWRSSKPRNTFVDSGVFGTTLLDSGLDCNELYWIKGTKQVNLSATAVINCSGEVIGIGFYNSTFLPINIVSRWWKHFKSCREYCRPWLGMEVANLHSLRLGILNDFMTTFPSISTGVVVTKVTEDSPAFSSGLRPTDVIVECNGKLVRSKLEFFDTIWDKVGETLVVSVLRVTYGDKVKLNLTVGETTPDKFYKWRLNDLVFVPSGLSWMTT